MALRDILTVPNPVLRQISDPVDAVTDAHRALMDDMLETMYAAPGIGLAAIQVGVPLRIIVMDLADGEEAPAPRYFVNPVIREPSDRPVPYQEGCLSVPEYFEDVERPDRCVVDYLDYDGEARTLECEGMLAVCIQHEMDHLNGVLFIDHLSRLKRERILKKMKKDQKAPLATAS